MQDNHISLTPSAVDQILTLLEDEPNGHTLRLVVEGGGCAGMQYKFDLVKPKEDDLLFKTTHNNKTALIATNNESINLIKGSEIKYVNGLEGRYFSVDNPNASSGCGCGNSFS